MKAVEAPNPTDDSYKESFVGLVLLLAPIIEECRSHFKMESVLRCWEPDEVSVEMPRNVAKELARLPLPAELAEKVRERLDLQAEIREGYSCEPSD